MREKNNAPAELETYAEFLDLLDPAEACERAGDRRVAFYVNLLTAIDETHVAIERFVETY